MKIKVKCSEGKTHKTGEHVVLPRGEVSTRVEDFVRNTDKGRYALVLVRVEYEDHDGSEES